ncbi:MAG: hypothetical protein E7249_17915 [Paenibacillaceae bacterium]|nr:hypothetical protein [Paenibacillaceae bacterium]
MSNPAVITLASLSDIKGFPYRFEIEDNIGEAIHIHYKDIRMDLTIKEFLELAEAIEEIINDLVEVEEFRCRDFDPVNLVGLAPLLPFLSDIIYTEVFLEDLIVDTYDEGGNPVLLNLKCSRIIKALQGHCGENDSRKQVNYYNNFRWIKQDNSERLQYNLEQIKKNGYPVNKELITLFNNDNILYDGQHRAACLYYLYGNIKVPVRRLLFKDNKFSNNKLDTLHSDRVEVLGCNGAVSYGTWQEGEGVYEISANVESVIIHKLPLSEEIIIDISGVKRGKEDGKFMIEIHD